MNKVNLFLSNIPKLALGVCTLALLAGSGTYALAIAADEMPGQANMAGSQLEEKQVPKEKKVPTHVGKLDKALHEKLQKLPPGAKIRVGIWLKSPPVSEQTDPRAGSVVSDIDAVIQARTQRQVTANLAHSKGVADFIKQKGAKINLVSRLAPLIYAEVRAKDI